MPNTFTTREHGLALGVITEAFVADTITFNDALLLLTTADNMTEAVSHG